jgi:histidine kinase/YXYXY domain-containing protein
MVRKLLLLLMSYTLVTSTGAVAMPQNSPLPGDFVFNTHADMNQYTRYIIPCVDWLQQTPLSEEKAKERERLNDFVIKWLQVNPDINISMPEYSFKFNGINREFLCLFLEGWIKYTLQTKDTATVNCSTAGIKSMLDFYNTGKAAYMGKIDFLDNLAQIEKEGKLKDLFDTGQNARNTYLYLTAPYKKHEFRYDENYFGFHYYCINLLNPRAITYRYKLDGYYENWIVTKDASVTFPRLPPGNYDFRIQASMYPNFEHAVESSYSFYIGRPVWEQPWFLALAAIAAFLIVYFIVKQREKNLKNLALVEQMRITFEYEHLKSQVNPHFLFNSFNTLSNLIGRDQKKAIDYAENLSGLYHNILAYHGNDFVLLSEEFEILNDYISIQKGRFGDALQLKIDVPEEVMRTKNIVPMALQMLIENAIKHNVVSAGAPLIIMISANNTEITIRNVLHPKISKEKGRGLGLINIKRRYDMLTNEPVTYGQRGNEYFVILPLL